MWASYFLSIYIIGTASWTSRFANFEEDFTQYKAQSSAYEGFLRFLTFIIVLQVSVLNVLAWTSDNVDLFAF